MIDDNIWAHALWNWVWTVVLTTAPLEFMHGRNRMGADPRQLFLNFCAASVNGETKSQFEQQRRAILSLADGRGLKRKHAVGDRTDGVTRRTRTPSVRDVVREDEIAARQELRQKVYVTSSEFIAAVEAGVQETGANLVRKQEYLSEIERANHKNMLENDNVIGGTSFALAAQQPQRGIVVAPATVMV